jgi:hypothetical protein
MRPVKETGYEGQAPRPVRKKWALTVTMTEQEKRSMRLLLLAWEILQSS